MNHKQATLANKLKVAQDKNKTLNRRIQRKEKQITNLKLLFKHLKDKNILENDTVLTLTNDFGNLVSLLQNEKKNRDKSAHGRRYCDEVNRFAVTMHYYSAKAYNYCRWASFFPFHLSTKSSKCQSLIHKCIYLFFKKLILA